jgi:hypothetical protein
VDAFLVGLWCRLSGKGRALTQRTRRAQSPQRRNRVVMAYRSTGVRERGRERGRNCWRLARTRECLPASPPLRKQDQYTGKRNEVKRIIVPTGYSNDSVGGLGRRFLCTACLCGGGVCESPYQVNRCDPSKVRRPLAWPVCGWSLVRISRRRLDGLVRKVGLVIASPEHTEPSRSLHPSRSTCAS